jgi:hypothetical protein
VRELIFDRIIVGVGKHRRNSSRIRNIYCVIVTCMKYISRGDPHIANEAPPQTDEACFAV